MTEVRKQIDKFSRLQDKQYIFHAQGNVKYQHPILRIVWCDGIGEGAKFWIQNNGQYEQVFKQNGVWFR